MTGMGEKKRMVVVCTPRTPWTTTTLLNEDMIYYLEQKKLLEIETLYRFINV